MSLRPTIVRIARLQQSCIFGVVLLLAAPEQALAAEPVAPSPQDSAAAQALFEQGRALMDSGRAAEACPRFEESQRLEPGLGTRFHLAACYEALGKTASAHALFLEVAAESKARDQAERERVARERAGALEPKLSRLTIEVPFVSAASVQIERDGSPIGSAQWGVAIPVDPGKHRIRASAPGRVPWSTEVEVRPGGTSTRVSVPPLPEQQRSFFAPASRKVGLLALGAGAGAIALGGVFAAQAISKNDASERAGCSDQACPSEAALSLRRQALSAGDRATWAAGAGAVGLAAAAALFWVVPVSDEQQLEMQLAPSVARSGASLRLRGWF